MGNSVSNRSSLSEASEGKRCVYTSRAINKSRVLDIDPRSPSEGIVRTPIQVDQTNDIQFDGIRFSKNGDCVVETVHHDTAIELSNFETLDCVLTEDDSLHGTHLGDEGTAALSDTELTTRRKKHTDLSSQNQPSRARLSWVERFSKRKSSYDSPSLFVRLRQKNNYEKQKTSRQLCQHGDGSDAAHTHASKTVAT
ncbi:unnamed protein product [Dicrocoelium dendriticum]|nr:unnamed protein product [Dicrocoelium dendriticum]